MERQVALGFGMILLVAMYQLIMFPTYAEDTPEPTQPETVLADEFIDGADPAEGETPQPGPPPSEQPPAFEAPEFPASGSSGISDDWYDWSQQGSIEAEVYAQAEQSLEERELLEQINISLRGIFNCILLGISCIGVYLILRMVWPLFKG